MMDHMAAQSNSSMFNRNPPSLPDPSVQNTWEQPGLKGNTGLMPLALLEVTVVLHCSVSTGTLQGGQVRCYSSLTTLEKNIPAWRDTPLPVPACVWSFACWIRSTFQYMIVLRLSSDLDLGHKGSKFNLSTFT